MRNPYVFVVGCPRSGTTLLQRMLNHHPQLALANDTHFIPRCLETAKPEAVDRVLEAGDVELTAELCDGVRKYHRLPRLGLSESEVEQALSGASTYREFVCDLYSRFARGQHKPLAGEKTPDYVYRLPLLAALFPWARMVHIVRDGRDVALSTLEWAHEDKGPGKLELWKEQPVAVCALWWRWMVTSGREAASKLGTRRCMELRYEDLVADPTTTLRSVTDFLELPFAEEMLDYHKGLAEANPHRAVKRVWLPPTPGLRDWRNHMCEQDVELFEALAGDLLSELGYDRAVECISPEVAQLADSCRHWWRAHHSDNRRGSFSCP